jgi:hypothetical protein
MSPSLGSNGLGIEDWQGGARARPRVGRKRSGDLAACQRQPGTRPIVRLCGWRDNRTRRSIRRPSGAQPSGSARPHLARRSWAAVEDPVDRDAIREQVATQRRQVFGVEGEEGGLAVVATALWPLILVGASLHLNLGQL